MTPDALRSRIFDAIRQEPSPVRRQVRARMYWALASSALAPIALFLIVGAVRLGARPWSLFVTTTLGTLVIALVAAWIAVGGRHVLGRARVTLLTMAVALPVALATWKLTSSCMYEGMMALVPERPGARCFGLTLLLAAWPLAAICLSRRGTDATHPNSLGAAIGIAAGLYAGVFVDLFCPVGHVGHVLFGHVLPVVLLGLAGIWMGNRLLAVRAARRDSAAR